MKRKGAILSAELVVVLAITVFGTAWGLSILRDTIRAELQDVSGSLRSLKQPNLGAYQSIGSGKRVNELDCLQGKAYDSASIQPEVKRRIQKEGDNVSPSPYVDTLSGFQQVSETP